MHHTDPDLAALGRIIRSIKTFRAAFETTNQSMDATRLSHYLSEHLTPHDWALWQLLQRSVNQLGSPTVSG